MPGRPSIYKGTDGLYHCYVTVGKKSNGDPKRVNVSAKQYETVVEKVKEVERRRDDGERLDIKTLTVGDWLTYYLDNVVRPAREPKTYESYRPIINLHLLPYIGRYRLAGSRNVLQVDHVEQCYARLSGRLAPSYVLQVHRVLSRALRIAVRRGYASRNVCDLLDGPSAPKRKPKPLKAEAIRKLIPVVRSDRMHARWMIALLLGLRQGEVLGLRWSDIELDGDAPMIELSIQAQRRAWQHGCSDPRACAVRRCRTRPCRPRGGRPCPRHRRPESCAMVCQPGCVRHAAACPKRTGGGIVDKPLKGARSEEGVSRNLPLSPLLVDELREHRRQWREEKMAAASWPHGDLVFVNPNGSRIDATRDHEAWERLLVAAGIPDAPLHAARHSAGTMLLATGTDLAVVQEFLGHSDIRVTRGYVEVAEELKRKAIDRLTDALVQQLGATVDQPKRSSRQRKPS